MHTFRDIRGWLFDEDGNQLDTPVGPVGDAGVHSFRTIDDLVSDALSYSPRTRLIGQPGEDAFLG